jgi:hypothetical protein
LVLLILFRLDSIILLDPSVELYNYLWNGCNQVDIGPIDLIAEFICLEECNTNICGTRQITYGMDCVQARK